MGHSFTGDGAGSLGKSQAVKRRVLVTGAAGRIGSYFAEHSFGRYDLRLMVQHEEQIESVRAWGEVVQCDLGDLAGMKKSCAGIDTVVHMAGNPDAAATWQPLLEANIIGTYNAMVAAKSAGCRRLIFASSIHAVSGYSREVQVKTSEPPSNLPGAKHLISYVHCSSIRGIIPNFDKGNRFVVLKMSEADLAKTAYFREPIRSYGNPDGDQPGPAYLSAHKHYPGVAFLDGQVRPKDPINLNTQL